MNRRAFLAVSAPLPLVLMAKPKASARAILETWGWVHPFRYRVIGRGVDVSGSGTETKPEVIGLLMGHHLKNCKAAEVILPAETFCRPLYRRSIAEGVLAGIADAAPSCRLTVVRKG